MPKKVKPKLLKNKKKSMKFIEDSHVYIEDGEKYTPVTTFLHYFEPYVDWDEQCRIKAKKLGISFEELKAQWNAAKVNGASRGTKFHKFMEDQLISDKSKVIKYSETVDGEKYDASVKLSDNTIYPEKMVWSKKYKICGTADIVEVKDGVIHIKDYKTNKELKTSSYVDKVTGQSSKLKHPVGALDNCNFNIYQLQLNLYMFMLLQHNRNLKMGDMTILHVGFNDDGKAVSMIPYKVKNLQAEVKSMLEYYNKTKR